MIRRFSVGRHWRGRFAGLLCAALGLSALAGASLPAGAHPVHVSSTQVDLSRDGKSLEVTVRLFTDDLEEALKAAGHPVVVTRAAAATVDSALSSYLADRLQFGLDGRPPARGRLIGHEREDDATLVFVEVPLRTMPTRVTVVQRVMLDLFEDQTNLLHLRFGTKKRSALLRRGNERAEWVL